MGRRQSRGSLHQLEAGRERKMKMDRRAFRAGKPLPASSDLPIFRSHRGGHNARAMNLQGPLEAGIWRIHSDLARWEP